MVYIGAKRLRDTISHAFLLLLEYICEKIFTENWYLEKTDVPFFICFIAHYKKYDTKQM